MSWLTYRCRSVPAKSTDGLPGYSWMLRTDSSDASPLCAAVHVLPKSVVRTMYGAKSPVRCASNATIADPLDADEATMRATYVPLLTPAGTIAALTSFHDLPPSVETCTLPSSVPTHNTLGSSGDSAMVVISLKL